MMLAFAPRAEVSYFSTDTVSVPEGEISAIEVRAANPTSRVGSSKRSGWAITWPGVEISLIFDFRNYVDGISNVAARLDCNGSTVEISKGLNTSGGFNSIAVEWQSDGQANILAGERKLSAGLTVAGLPKPRGRIRVRPFGGDAEVQEVIIETNSHSFDRLQAYQPEQLIDAPRWEYLDRTNDPTTAVVGGQYVLAQVGHDLVYLGGAVTNAGSWRPGMLKGRLIPTGFDNYYKLIWYDATGRKMPGENFAEHDAAPGILTLSFPGLGASIRLKLAVEQ